MINYAEPILIYAILFIGFSREEAEVQRK